VESEQLYNDTIMYIKKVRFEVLTAVKIQAEFFWVVPLCSVVVEFGGTCCLHLQGEDGGSMDLT
jgi:hypothetical protein